MFFHAIFQTRTAVMLVWIKDSQNYVHNCTCDITKTSASVLLLQALLSHDRDDIKTSKNSQLKRASALF